MKVLVILTRSQAENPRLLVAVKKEDVRCRVRTLLQEERSRDAFELVKRHGTVERYLPPGAKIPLVPEITLIEDLL